MTTEAARALADHFQERCDHMGPEHPETHRLGKLISAVRDLAAQVDALTPTLTSVDAEPPPTRKKKKGDDAA